jgi:septal ring factor EnvC (AmiA/AmiB activator)
MQRPVISQTVIDEFTKVIDSQDGKGFAKYHTTIDQAKDADYDWKLMAIEETADLQKYLVKEIKRLEHLIYRLNKDLQKAEEENQWLTQQYRDAKSIISTLRTFQEVNKCIHFQEENNRLVERNDELRSILNELEKGK